MKAGVGGYGFQVHKIQCRGGHIISRNIGGVLEKYSCTVDQIVTYVCSEKEVGIPAFIVKRVGPSQLKIRNTVSDNSFIFSGDLITGYQVIIGIVEEPLPVFIDPGKSSTPDLSQGFAGPHPDLRSEEHTSELQSRGHL